MLEGIVWRPITCFYNRHREIFWLKTLQPLHNVVHIPVLMKLFGLWNVDVHGEASHGKKLANHAQLEQTKLCCRTI